MHAQRPRGGVRDPCQQVAEPGVIVAVGGPARPLPASRRSRRRESHAQRTTSGRPTMAGNRVPQAQRPCRATWLRLHTAPLLAREQTEHRHRGGTPQLPRGMSALLWLGRRLDYQRRFVARPKSTNSNPRGHSTLAAGETTPRVAGWARMDTSTGMKDVEQTRLHISGINPARSRVASRGAW